MFGAAQPPSFGRICEAFGPTYPGEPTGGQYPLQYPGVLFLFPQPSAPQQEQQQQHQPQQQRLGAGSGAELPVPLSTPASRIIIHHGSAASLAVAQAAPPPALPHGSTYFEAVEAVAGQGLLLCGGGQLLRFGDSPQDLTSELGQPSSTHTKPARPAPSVPHCSGALLAGGGGGTAPDYVYCYAQRGLDALFCGTSHRLKKLVLHANPPGHPSFGLYSKCNFRCVRACDWCWRHVSFAKGVLAAAESLDEAADAQCSNGSSVRLLRLMINRCICGCRCVCALESAQQAQCHAAASIPPSLQGAPCRQLELAGPWRQRRRGGR